MNHNQSIEISTHENPYMNQFFLMKMSFLGDKTHKSNVKKNSKKIISFKNYSS